MRLVIGTLARGPIGGVETYLRGLTPQLVARGYEVGVLYEHRHEPAPASPDPYAGCAADWCVEELHLTSVLAQVQAWQPELIWIHGLQSAELEAQLLTLAPAVLFAHNYDGTCATGSKLHLWPHPQACTRRMSGACAAMNFTRNCGRLRPSGFTRQWRRQRQRAEQLHRYRRIFVASRHMAIEFGRQGVAAERLVRLPYPRIGPAPQPPAARPGPPRHVVMMSRLTRAKGGLELVRACAAAQRQLGRELQLTIAGDGPERDRLRTAAGALRLNAAFPGWIGPGDRAQLLAVADVMAVPSLWPEPFGMVGIEAAGFGVPAVGFDVGGIPDWLRPGVNGEMAGGDPPTAAGLAAALVRVLGDHDRWETLRQGAYAGVEAYDLAGHVERLDWELKLAVST